MKLPDLRYASGIRKNTQVKFGGLNMTLGAADGELVRCENLTSDHSPVLATRPKRYRVCLLGAPGGLYSHDGLVWVDGTTLYWRGEAVGQVTAGRKTFCSMGAWLVILPDKAYYNVKTGEFGSLEAAWSGENVSFENGLYKEEIASANALRCRGVDFGKIFREGDAVTISGCVSHGQNNKTAIIRAIDIDTLYFSENCFTLSGEAGDEAYTEAAVTVERKVPDLKYIWQNENRLWGCDDTTIYASAWGDIFNWNTFDGIDSDSWTLEPGSPGGFTGCVSFKGYPIFFKEDMIYKIYGSAPSDYSCMGSSTMGLQEGCERSFAVADEVLFYLGRNGITAYSGGIPTWIAESFGTERFFDAVGGSDGLKYYVSMTDRAGQRHLYVYDTRFGCWLREDDLQVTDFAWYDGGLYMLSADGQIWLCGGARDIPEGAVLEEDFFFEAEFADLTWKEPNKKYIHKLQLRLELGEQATAQAWIQFDSDGRWIRFGDQMGPAVKKSYVLPIVPRRCDHFRIKITGRGQCRIWSLSQHIRGGSEFR